MFGEKGEGQEDSGDDVMAGGSALEIAEGGEIKGEVERVHPPNIEPGATNGKHGGEKAGTDEPVKARGGLGADDLGDVIKTSERGEKGNKAERQKARAKDISEYGGDVEVERGITEWLVVYRWCYIQALAGEDTQGFQDHPAFHPLNFIGIKHPLQGNDDVEAQIEKGENGNGYLNEFFHTGVWLR